MSSELIHAQNITLQDTLELSNQGSIILNANDYLNQIQNIDSNIDSVQLSNVDNFDCDDIGNQSIDLIGYKAGVAEIIDLELSVQDTTTPSIQLKPNNSVNIYLNNNGEKAILSNDLLDDSSDNCSVENITFSPSVVNCSHLGNQTIIVTAQDGSGNAVTDSIEISINDNIPPAINVGQTTFYLDANGEVTIAGSDVNGNTTDNCDNNFEFWLSDSTFTHTEIGFNALTFFAENSKGETSSTNVTILIKDTIPPVINSSVQTVFLDASGEVTVNPGIFNDGISDNSLIYSLSLSQTVFDCDDIDTNSLTLTATDNYNNSSSVEVTLIVEDKISPIVIAQNAIVSIDATGTATLNVNDINNGSHDNCSIDLSLSQTNFTCADIGIHNIYLNGTDASGNTGTDIAQITVVDNSSPVVLSQDINAYLNENGTIIIDPVAADNGSFDLCSDTLSFELSENSFDCDDIGAHQVTFTVNDDQGNNNSSTINIQVSDTISPTVILQTIDFALDSSGTLILTQELVDNGSFDNCSDNVEFTFTDSVFGVGNIGPNTTTIHITDNSNNTTIINNYGFNIIDSIAPVITDPIQDILAYSVNNSCGTNILFNPPTVVENTGNYNIFYSHNPGSYFEVGKTLVTYTVIDNQNNSSIDSFEIHVIDTVAPTLIAGITTYQQDTFNVVTWDTNQLVFFENCSPNISYSLSHNSGDTFNIGITNVTITVTDTANNSATYSFPIEVEDLVKPEFVSAPNNLVYYVGENGCSSTISYPTPVVTDNSPIDLSYTHPSGMSLDVGNYQSVITAVDTFGNEETHEFTIQVLDTIKPKFTTFPSNIDLGECNNIASYNTPVAEDNCGVQLISRLSGPSSGDPLNPGTYVVSYKVTDVNNNETIKSFTIVVHPMLNNELNDITLNCGSTETIDFGSQHPHTTFTGSGVSNNVFDPNTVSDGHYLIFANYSDPYGCTAVDSFYVNKLIVPLKPIILQTQVYTLTTHNSYSEYQWYKNGELIPGAIYKNHNITTGGNYEVIVRNDVGCFSQSQVYNIGGGNHPSLNIEELNQNGYLVFPNPAESSLTLISKEIINEDNIFFFNVMGQAFKAPINSVNSFHKNVDISELPKGIYFVKFQAGNTLFTQKIFIK
jgi:hypothetical protein